MLKKPDIPNANGPMVSAKPPVAQTAMYASTLFPDTRLKILLIFKAGIVSLIFQTYTLLLNDQQLPPIYGACPMPQNYM